MMQCIGCPRGRFTDGVGFSECTACPMGRFSSSDSQSACEACAPGKYMLSTQSSECLQCERGKFSNVTAALSCEMCDPGFFSDVNSTECEACPEGHESEFPGSVSCSKCEAGRFNPRAGGRCMQCPLGTIANESGLASCQVCNLSLIWPLTSDVERVYCVTEGWVFVGCLCIMAGCSFFLILLPYAFRYRAEIEDITLDRADGRCRVIIRTHGRHWLPHRSVRSFFHDSFARFRAKSSSGTFVISGAMNASSSGRHAPAVFFDTGHPFLDAPSANEEEGWILTEAAAIEAEASALYYWAKPLERTESKQRIAGHLIQPVTTHHLILLCPDGLPSTRSIETSKGVLRIPFPLTLIMVSIPGSFVSLGCSMLLSVLLALLPFLVMISSPEGAKWVYGLSSVVSVLIAIGFHMTAASLQPLTPTQRKLRRHIKNMAGCNPNPMLTRREKGPHRAIRAGHLLDLATTFHDCIRHRDMYYVATNIIKPVTKPYRLSYAECVGPQDTKWFVSHYWGTSFQHFAASIQKHSEAVVEPHYSATDVPYWICSFSNNQWQLEEALPLTRAWCLFEVLQTMIIRRENFKGLYLCTTTGVLQKGKSGVDLPMRIAERLAKLRLEDATASDKEMISKLVSEMPGGFQAMNAYLKRNIAEALRTMQVRRGTYSVCSFLMIRRKTTYIIKSEQGTRRKRYFLFLL
ncbi:unnamed protein product [Durusdinium trenchii]|uniref:Tyrosine-protein kinase ephrin type A/B receptor-like domain-containing protein n=1 Tax=Durusdinium trenchii TaxID=1381693 RepID=A0ABP0LMZ9_9DINO